MLFGSGSASVMLDDVEDEDAIDFIFVCGRLTLDESGTLKVPKHEPLELEERVQHRMYRARVLEGDLPLVFGGLFSGAR